MNAQNVVTLLKQARDVLRAITTEITTTTLIDSVGLQNLDNAIAAEGALDEFLSAAQPVPHILSLDYRAVGAQEAQQPTDSYHNDRMDYIRKLASDCMSEPLSRPIDDIEAAGEELMFLVSYCDRLRVDYENRKKRDQSDWDRAVLHGQISDAEITAGAAILCDCETPKPIGRNAAIDVFHAMHDARARLTKVQP